jgi:hypothetical protein
MPVSKSVVEIETWYEICANCDCLLGDKKFTSEKEFDEHPDREIGYTNCDTQDEWLCPDCRDDDAIYCDECGNKVPEGDMTIVNGWDWCPDCVGKEDTAFCDECDSTKPFLQKDLVDGYCPDCDAERQERMKMDEAKCYWCNARGCDTTQNGNPIHADCA